MSSGLSLMLWSWETKLKGFRWLDPTLSMRFVMSLAEGEPSVVARLRQTMQIEAAGAKRLQVPVPSGAIVSSTMGSGHWTLLSIDFTETGDVEAVRYRDSLSFENAGNRGNAQLVLSVFNSGAVLPERCHLSYQPTGSALCGWWVLAWYESEAYDHMGSGPSVLWPSELHKWLKPKLNSFHASLKAEIKKLAEDHAKTEEKREKELKRLEKLAMTAAKASEGKAELYKLEVVAQKNLLGPLWVDHLTEADLPEARKHQLSLINPYGPLVCGSCRCSSGCYHCDPTKALRYHLQKHRSELAAVLFACIVICFCQLVVICV